MSVVVTESTDGRSIAERLGQAHHEASDFGLSWEQLAECQVQDSHIRQAQEWIDAAGHAGLTILPDALLDDDAISPMAKMAYWYLKRHGGRARIEDVAVALRSRMTWAHIDDLAATGWVTVPDDPAELSGEPIQFAVHEVAVTAR